MLVRLSGKDFTESFLGGMADFADQMMCNAPEPTSMSGEFELDLVPAPQMGPEPEVETGTGMVM